MCGTETIEQTEQNKMAKKPNYSKEEKTIFALCLIIASLSYIAYFNISDNNIKLATMIPLILSFSEIIFIIIYRDLIYTSDDKDKYDHDTFIISIIKAFSLGCGLVASLVFGAILVFVAEAIKAIIPTIPYIFLAIIIFGAIVTANEIIVRRLYKKPKK
jgi:hypothetical protein